MNFNEILKDLRDEKRVILSEKQYIENKEQEELEQSKKLIQEKYSEDKKILDKSLNENYEKIEEQCKLIEEYSKFYSREIITILDDIIRIYEGERYSFQNTYYHIDPKRSILIEKIAIFVKKDKEKVNGYSYQYFKSLLKHGNVLVLAYDNDFFTNKEIKFYVDDGKHNIKQTIRYGKFQYIKDFIDYVINYRIKNNIEDISFETLNELKLNFIESKVDEIYLYYDNLYKADEEKYKERLEKDKQHREKQLKKIKKKNTPYKVGD